MSELKASKGQPVTAEAFNRVVDRLPGTSQGFPVNGSGVSRVEIRMRNTSGVNYGIGRLVAIGGRTGPPVSDLYSVMKHSTFDIAPPVWHTSIASLAMLGEPIPDGERGLAVAEGVCLSVGDFAGDKPYAMVDPANTEKLKGADSGIARIITKIDATHAIVMLGDACRLWRYELTEDSLAPGTTKAMLVNRFSGTFANSINLRDPLSLMDDQVSGDEGLCMQCGNDFEAINAPC